MIRTIQINVEVDGLKGNVEAYDFAVNLVEHITDTFNDNESIKACWPELKGMFP